MMSNVLQVELTKGKIKLIMQQVEKNKTVFSDKHYLESLSLPSFIIGRDREARQLVEIIHSKSQGYVAPFVCVYGKSGTGKTTVTKLVCEGLSDYISYAFVNLRKVKTVFGCANLILDQLDEKPLKSWDGINKVLDLIEKRISDILVRDKKQKFILVLDEFDEIFSDSRNNPSDFVYKLLMMVEDLRAKNFLLCIFAISNTNLSNYGLDDRIKSRMDSCELIFKPYSQKAVERILQDRAEKAFSVDVPNEVITRCAELCSYESGDCRRAIQLLRIVGETADDGALSAKDVDEAFNRLNQEECQVVVKNATPHEKLLLMAMSKLVLNSEKAEHSTQEIYQEYECIRHEPEIRNLSYRRAFDLLCSLENTGIIIGRTQSFGRNGYHKMYRLTADHGLVGYYIDANWWNEQVGNKISRQEYDEAWKEKRRKLKR